MITSTCISNMWQAKYCRIKFYLMCDSHIIWFLFFSISDALQVYTYYYINLKKPLLLIGNDLKDTFASNGIDTEIKIIIIWITNHLFNDH